MYYVKSTQTMINKSVLSFINYKDIHFCVFLFFQSFQFSVLNIFFFEYALLMMLAILILKMSVTVNM